MYGEGKKRIFFIKVKKLDGGMTLKGRLKVKRLKRKLYLKIWGAVNN